MLSSDEDGAKLMAAFKRKGNRNLDVPPAKPLEQQTSTSSNLTSDHDPGDEPGTTGDTPEMIVRKAIYVRVLPVRNKAEYTYYEPKEEVEGILRQRTKDGQKVYEVRLFGDRTKEITLDKLLLLPGGRDALQELQTETEDNDMKLRDRTSRVKQNDFIDISTIDLSSSSSEIDDSASTSRKPRSRRLRTLAKRETNSDRSSRTRSRHSDIIQLSTSDDDSEEKGGTRKRRRQAKIVPEPTRRSSRHSTAVHIFEGEDDENENENENEESTDDSSDSDILQSDILPNRKRKRRVMRPVTSEKEHRTGIRQSDRSTRTTKNMQEADANDIYRSDSEPKVAAQKMMAVREVFITLPRSNLFRSRHVEGCEVCFDGPNVAPLIYCQGCSLAYHKNCLGTRSTRDHLVTKVGDQDFVLQCKRCINMYKKKDAIAPDLSKCQDCAQPGTSCKPFRRRKTTAQEMKDRDDNGGQDPVVDVLSELINNAHNVLFRCTKCSRAWHYYHLPPLSQYAMDVNRDDEEMADERFREYSGKWLCKECNDTDTQKVSGIIAWRPSDIETYRPGTACDLVSEDDKQYLVKWEKQSYFRAAWYSGPWTWGVTTSSMRKAFFKREDGPKMRTEDAIPEEYLRIDIVLDIKYTNYVEVRSEEIDKARIKEVDKALIKYKGLGYEDAVWETVPTSEDGDRWLDFVTAYNDWVAGRYVKYPKQAPLKARLEKARSTPFAKLEREKQPENLVGGELMRYQVEGLNWLYYQWYSQKNGILADEMGLGKTIQIIAFMATLIQEHNCFPFLIVVPNSTCANWRREIKQWAPSLRVVAYFGSAQAREMAYKYEMYPEGTKELRCHIVVTSYEAATDDSCKRVFRSVSWGGLIVDEGQRLKNDKSQLYTALMSVKAPFRLLLTGTPLQNNARELFNLMQFLDETIDAAELEEKYTEMTSENIKELHDQIRPFILRRTKAQVLTFLPPLGQVILPISMTHLQKQLYKSILSKSPELLKALFTSDKALKQQERANLSNILMQLRKCLCHPFVYSREIEERTDVAAVSHRNLVEASAKLSILELLLPKLKERGHRVLIFSQFLDMLSIIEDFLDGMQLSYQRLDGTMGSLEKQKRIDQYNAPDSTLFAFLLSTRAGGVGINLATADTVIILDPDWNPHQDIQAIARAHRIGQKKKVLCLQLTTRASVEEKIMQMGRKKMALDHIVVEQMDTTDIEDQDVESILKFGAAELFKDDGTDSDIRYDDASIDKLLDRSQIENTKTSSDNSAESQFSFARIWANEKGSLQDDFDTVDEEVAPDPGVWDKILKERQAAAAAEALARAEAMGRGRRAKAAVDYATEGDGIGTESVAGTDVFEDSLALPSPIKKSDHRRKKNQAGSESDTDFQAESEEGSEAEPMVSDVDAAEVVGDGRHHNASTSVFVKPSKGTSANAPKTAFTAPQETLSLINQTLHKRGGERVSLLTAADGKSPSSSAAFGLTDFTAIPAPLSLQNASSIHGAAVKPFQRVNLPTRSPFEPTYASFGNHICPACHKNHPQGACELKAAGVEHCGLCGLAHYGHSRTCPHIKSETQVREMLQALKSSPEKKELVDAAIKYLRGVKGTLVQQKKRDREKAALVKNGVPLPGFMMGKAPLIAGQLHGQQQMYSGPPGLVNGMSQNQNQNQISLGPPTRGPQPTYSGLMNANSGHTGSHTQERTALRQAQKQAHQKSARFEDQEVESALRGFLGH